MKFAAIIATEDLAGRAARGSLAGAAIGVLFLAVGLLRAGFYLVSGGHVAGLAASDVREMAYYLGGFTVAGAVIGAAWPMFRGQTGTYLGFALGGAIVGAAI